jgi:hypothetical protein
VLGLGNTLSGGIVPAAAAAGFADSYSLSFDGVDDYVDLDNAASGISGIEGTISFWFKPTDNYLFEIKVDADNYISAYFSSGSDYASCTRRADGGNDTAASFSGGSGNDGNWHHAAYTWSESGDKFIAYADGSAETTRTSINSWDGTPSIFTLGKHTAHWSGGYYSGNINDVSIWNSALSAGDISDIYNSGTVTDLSGESGLIGYWKFEENTGTTVEDSSSSNDGTLVNGTAFDSDTP